MQVTPTETGGTEIRKSKISQTKKNSPDLKAMPNESSMTAEEIRLAEDRGRTKNWKRWGPYLSERNGRPCAKITRHTEIVGIISPTIMLAAAPIAGAKTDCWGLLTASAGSVLVWPYGMGVIRF